VSYTKTKKGTLDSATMKTVASSADAKPRAPSCSTYYMGLRIANPPPWIDDVIGGVRDGKFKMHKYMLQASYINIIRARVITGNEN
jgi:hypothetical protein